MAKIKLKDVAERAGVSLTAVSFALNGKPGISEETRKNIFRIIEETGYSSASRDKRKNKLRNTGKNILFLNCSRTTITNDIFPQTPYFSELLQAFEEKLSASGYRFWIKSIRIGNNFEQDIVKMLKTSEINGVLLVATDMLEEDVKIVQSIERNVVILDSCYDRLEANCVVMDNYLGGVLAARHLLECGHQRIGYIQSGVRIYNFEMRKKGFMNELSQYGMSISEDDIFEVESSIDSSFNTLDEKIKTTKSLPTCFFAENDYMAIGMLRALQNNNISVPNDVALVGFDNIDMAGIVSPGLTTINVPKNKLAEFCVTQMKYIINNEPVVGIKHFVSVNIIKRNTTKII